MDNHHFSTFQLTKLAKALSVGCMIAGLSLTATSLQAEDTPVEQQLHAHHHGNDGHANEHEHHHGSDDGHASEHEHHHGDDGQVDHDWHAPYLKHHLD